MSDQYYLVSVRVDKEVISFGEVRRLWVVVGIVERLVPDEL
ncbi:hypothetical protein ACF07U_27265 [Streptomyces californicus]